MLVGFAGMAIAMHVDYRRLREPRVVYTILGCVLALLVAVLFAPELNATRRWFFVGGVSIQPSELAKLALVPFLAYQIERKLDRVNTRDLLLPVALVTGVMAGPDRAAARPRHRRAAGGDHRARCSSWPGSRGASSRPGWASRCRCSGSW